MMTNDPRRGSFLNSQRREKVGKHLTFELPSSMKGAAWTKWANTAGGFGLGLELRVSENLQGFCWNVSALSVHLPFQAVGKGCPVLEQHFKKPIWFRLKKKKIKTNSHRLRGTTTSQAWEPASHVALVMTHFGLAALLRLCFALCTMRVGEGQGRFRLHILGGQTPHGASLLLFRPLAGITAGKMKASELWGFQGLVCCGPLGPPELGALILASSSLPSPTSAAPGTCHPFSLSWKLPSIRPCPSS